MAENEPVNVEPIDSAQDTESRARADVQPDEQQSNQHPAVPEPRSSDVAVDGLVCKRCGHTSPPGTQRCAPCGSMLRGNQLAVTHALKARGLPGDLQHLHAELVAFEAGCLVDEAEGDDLPTRRRALLGYRARLHRRICQLDDALELRGLVDRRGRLRATWLQQLQALIGAAKGLDALLGLERRQRQVDPLERVRLAVEEANRR